MPRAGKNRSNFLCAGAEIPKLTFHCSYPVNGRTGQARFYKSAIGFYYLPRFLPGCKKIIYRLIFCKKHEPPRIRIEPVQQTRLNRLFTAHLPFPAVLPSRRYFRFIAGLHFLNALSVFGGRSLRIIGLVGCPCLSSVQKPIHQRLPFVRTERRSRQIRRLIHNRPTSGFPYHTGFRPIIIGIRREKHFHKFFHTASTATSSDILWDIPAEYNQNCQGWQCIHTAAMFCARTKLAFNCCTRMYNG